MVLAIPACSAFAATSSEAIGGGYYGPSGFGGLRGYPARAQIPNTALDEEIASRLWHEAANLTGVSFENLREIKS